MFQLRMCSVESGGEGRGEIGSRRSGERRVWEEGWERKGRGGGVREKVAASEHRMPCR